MEPMAPLLDTLTRFDEALDWQDDDLDDDGTEQLVADGER